jgi:hypothetical protein
MYSFDATQTKLLLSEQQMDKEKSLLAVTELNRLIFSRRAVQC